MRHDDYVRSLIDDDAFRELQLKAARAAQDFDAAVAAAMEKAAINVEALAGLTRISEDRLQDLLDGDSPFVEEMLLIGHALHLDVYLDHRVELRVRDATEPTSSKHVVHYGYDINRSEKSVLD